jgi:NAD(P)-dependent dehydrogenase (short-subunit alcohol dehydrogenase family)
VESLPRKVAVVSGGAGGIGRAVVSRLAAAEFFPVILDKNEAGCREAVESLARQGREAEWIALDLRKKNEVREAFDRVMARQGRIDLLVNLAGGTLHARPIEDFTIEEWREVIDVNLKGTFVCCQAAIGPMKRQGKGCIVNTSSNFGLTGSPTRTAYSASKAAVIAFTKSLALELAPHDIRVNAVAPGLTATKRVMGIYTPEEWAELSKTIPAGRAADPKDIAEGVAFLASDESGYMTGQTLHVNGGLVMP